MDKFQEEVFSKGFNIKLWKKLIRYTKPYKNRLIVLSIYMSILAYYSKEKVYFFST
jgi:ATP-binding cassette subfamily B protein